MKVLAILLSFAAPGLVIPGLAAADPLTTALQALRQGRAAEAVVIYRDLADAGDGRAQFNLGLLYLDGRGVPQNHAEALYWAWRARLSGLPAAPALIAHLTPGAPPDLRAALAARLAADLQPRIDRGEGRAMLELSAILLDLAPKPDPVLGHVWQSLAAALDVPGAAAARDATAAALDPATRMTAEAQAITTLSDLCAKGLKGHAICAASGAGG